MGDAENTHPPSKKRAAGRELSRDNPGLDDEEDVSEQETGTFKRASEEVLANRRIVKVRRSQPLLTPPAPSSNPFAAIHLVPPTDSTAPPSAVEDAEKTASKEAESEDSVKQETEKGDKSEDGSEVEKPEAKEGTETETETESKKETESNNENKEKLDENKEKNTNTESASVNSFHQLSSTQNAFTGLVGTGFSSSSFSFGSISAATQPTFPSFSFGANGNPSLFGNPKSSDKTEANKTPSLQEVQVETGEENEKSVFTADSVLFEFLDGGWKERGKGELKVNILTTGTKKARLVMRARGNYRLILNASLFPDMKLTNMEKKGITFACLNSTGEEGKDGVLSTFALKFKDASVVEEFQAVVGEHKGNAAAVLQTPENSPKASEE